MMKTRCNEGYGRTRIRIGLVLLVGLILGVVGCSSNKKNADEKKLGGIKKRLNQVLNKTGGTVKSGGGSAKSTAPPPMMKQPFTDQLNALLKKGSAKKMAQAIAAIENSPAAFKVPLLGKSVVGVGLSPDKWTQNGEPAGLLVHNTGKTAVSHTIDLSCGAPPKKFPITVTLDDGKHKQKVVIKEISNQTVKLPSVAAGAKKLFIIHSDKTWTPGTQDRRILGVRVMVSIRDTLQTLFKTNDAAGRARLKNMVLKNQLSDNVTQLGANTMAVGLEGDFFTSGGPAAIVINNESKAAKSTELTFSCTATRKDLPLTATIHGPKGKKQRITFRKAQQQLAVLPEVAAGASEIFWVTTNKTWVPKHDKARKLGVRITHSLDYTLRSLLKRPNPVRRAKLATDLLDDVVEKTLLFGDNVVSVGLSGDRWTVAGEPAGIAVRNDFSIAFPLQLFISCGAKPKDLPITAIIDDGTEKKRVVFKNPGAQLVDIKPLPSGEKRLYIITTDKTWTPATHDKRWLGVNIGISLRPMLKAMSEAKANTSDLAKLGEGILAGDPIAKLNIIDEAVAAVGLTLDRWTEGKRPAAVVFRNTTAKAWTPTVALMTSNRLSDLPITAYIWDGKSTKTYAMKGPTGSIKLSKVPANSVRSYIFTTNKNFKSQLNNLQLGVQVGVARGAAGETAPPVDNEQDAPPTKGVKKGAKKAAKKK